MLTEILPEDDAVIGPICEGKLSQNDLKRMHAELARRDPDARPCRLYMGASRIPPIYTHRFAISSSHLIRLDESGVRRILLISLPSSR